MKPNKQLTIIFSSVVVVCLLAAMLISHMVERLQPAATLQEVLYVPSPDAIKRMSLGYTGLMADIYWTRAVQYFGSHHVVHARQYNLLFPLLHRDGLLDIGPVVFKRCLICFSPSFVLSKQSLQSLRNEGVQDYLEILKRKVKFL